MDALVNINGDRVPTLELLLMLTVIALLPSILVMMTSFTRIVIILSFVRDFPGGSVEACPGALERIYAPSDGD